MAHDGYQVYVFLLVNHGQCWIIMANDLEAPRSPPPIRMVPNTHKNGVDIGWAKKQSFSKVEVPLGMDNPQLETALVGGCRCWMLIDGCWSMLVGWWHAFCEGIWSKDFRGPPQSPSCCTSVATSCFDCTCVMFYIYIYIASWSSKHCWLQPLGIRSEIRWNESNDYQMNLKSPAIGAWSSYNCDHGSGDELGIEFFFEL